MGLGLSGLRLGLGQQLWGTVWSPANLFPTGTEEGLFLDFSDINTLYTDQTFATNISAIGDPVGGVLDKSQGGGLGDELVTNGGFDADSAWSKQSGVSISGGVCDFTSVASSEGVTTTLPISIVAGVSYIVEFDVITLTSGGFVARFTGGTPVIGSVMATTGHYRARFTAASSDEGLSLRANGPTTGSIDNVSVRELPGNHLIQATSTARPIWTRHPKSGVRNLLDYSDYQIVGAGYIGSSITTTKTAISGPTGTSDCTKIVAPATSTGHFVYENSAGVSSVAAVVSIYLKAAEYTKARINEVSANRFGANFDLVTGAVSATTGTSFVSAGSEDAGGGWWRCWIAHTATAASIGVGGFPDSSVPASGNPNYLGDGVSGVYSFGMQQEEGSTATTYQTRVSQYDVTEAGVDDCYGLTFDGVDDYMVTAANLDLSAEKETFIAGFSRGSDGANAVMFEHSPNYGVNDQTFAFLAATGTSGVAGFRAFGVSGSSDVSGYAINTNYVAGGQIDFSGPTLTHRRNGAQVGTATPENVGTYAPELTYLGARAAGALPFTGTIYGVTLTDYILDAEQLAALEAWTAANTPEVTLA